MNGPTKSHDRKLVDRLHRVEGQIRGITRMVEDGRYCVDVLTQVRAVQAALSKFETVMLKEHLDHCIEGAIAGGNADDQRAKAAELIQLLDRSR